MKSPRDLRQYTRISMKVDVESERISDQEKRLGSTDCVSMNGIFIDCDMPFDVGTRCRVEIFVGGKGSDVTVQAKAEVISISEKGMGVKLISHLELDSYNHLRKLVLYNADSNVDQVETEIKTHLDQIREQ